MGCVEMGAVRVKRMASARAGDAIQQWEQSIEAMTKEKKIDTLLIGSESLSEPGDDEDENTEIESIFKDGQAPYIGNLAVSHKFRRRGVASALVLEACSWAHTLWRAPCVWLHVEERNEAAIRLYKKLGFGCEARDPVWTNDVGRRNRLFLRSNGGTLDWSKARLAPVKLNGLEYLRWCWLDLKRVRQQRERL